MVELTPDGRAQLLVGRVYFTAAITLPAVPDHEDSCRWVAPASGEPRRGQADRQPPYGFAPNDRRLLPTEHGGICAETRWLTDPDDATRATVGRRLTEIVDQVTIADDPADRATWFTLEQALPH